MSVYPIPKNKVRSPGKIEQHEHCDIADARRTKLVDEVGDPITDSNPLPTSAILNADEINVDIQHPDTNLILRHTVVTANAEFELSLPDNTKRFSVHAADCSAVLRIAVNNPGGTASSYKEINLGAEYTSGDVDLPNNSKIYLQSDEDSIQVVLEAWYVS